jgi:hypothetical protein
MESKRADEIAKDFLLAEKRQRRVFTDKTLPMKISGVRVTYLNLFDQFHLPNRRGYISSDWTPTLAVLCAAFAAYIIMYAIGWVVDGFVNSHPRT